MAIFSVVALGLFSNINNVMLISKKNAVAPAIYEKDQVIRYEIVTTMDFFQRELVVNDCPDENGDRKLQQSEIKFCAKPMVKLKSSQQNFSFPRSVYWGSMEFLESERYVRDTMQRFQELREKMTASNTGNKKSLFEEALASCENATFDEKTRDISERSSYFICGFGENVLVQLKVNFWDYLSGQLTKCKDLNSKPGRGVQVVYRFFHISSFEDSGRTLYSIARHSSKLFIPKKVDTNFLPSRNLWDTEKLEVTVPSDAGTNLEEKDLPEYMKNCRAT